MKRPAEGPGTPLEPPGNRWPRWMAIQDKIRLTGLLRKKPRQRGFFYWVDVRRVTRRADRSEMLASVRRSGEGRRGVRPGRRALSGTCAALVVGTERALEDLDVSHVCRRGRRRSSVDDGASMVWSAAEFEGLHQSGRTWSGGTGDAKSSSRRGLLRAEAHRLARATALPPSSARSPTRPRPTRRSIRRLGLGVRGSRRLRQGDDLAREARPAARHVVGNGGAGLTDGWRLGARRPERAAARPRRGRDPDRPALGAPARPASRCRHSAARTARSLAGAMSTSTHGGDLTSRRSPTSCARPSRRRGRQGVLDRAVDEARRLTVDDRLAPLLPCADAEIVRDDAVFYGARVAAAASASSTRSSSRS